LTWDTFFPDPGTDSVESLDNQSIVSGASVQSGQRIPNLNQDKLPFQPGYEATLQQEHPIFYQYLLRLPAPLAKNT